jgi:hypothetical protein
VQSIWLDGKEKKQCAANTISSLKSPWFTEISTALVMGRLKNLLQLDLAVTGQNLGLLISNLLMLTVPTRPKLTINYSGAGAELLAAADAFGALGTTFPAAHIRVHAQNQDPGGLQAVDWLQMLQRSGIILCGLSLRCGTDRLRPRIAPRLPRRNRP